MIYTIAEIRNKMNEWEKDLIKREKKYIHFHSFSNFLYYYDQLPNDRIKQQVLNIFVDYLDIIESRGFNLTKMESKELADTLLTQTSHYYKDLGFKLDIKLSFVFFFGIIGDFLLYLLKLLPIICGVHIPILTLMMLSYYFYLRIFKRRYRLIYGIFY
jgi:hypothetical protein